MRNRRKYSRRGLGTVVTSVMLVAAVSIIGTFLVTWSNMTFAAQQQEVAEQTTSRINLINEDFVLEDVWFFQNQTDTYANVTIRNTGELALTVSNIYINNTEAWNEGQVILADSVETIDVQSDWEQGNRQSIWVKTARGAEIKQVWKS